MKGRYPPPPTPPSREAMYQVTTERADLYRCRPPEGLRVTLLVQPVEVGDVIPLEVEIDLEVRGLKGGISGGVVRHARGISEGVAMGSQS